MKMKRLLLATLISVIGLFLVGSLATWFVLSSWVPTKGKARLIQELERRGAIDVSIGAMRYEPFRGLLLEDVRIVDHVSHELWLSTPRLRAQVSWAAMLLQQRLAFRVYGPLEVPCRTTADVSGRYQLRTKRLSLEVETTEIPLQSITAPLKSRVPSSLHDGQVQLNLHLVQTPEKPATWEGEIIGTNVVWSSPPYRLTGDVTLTGQLTLPSREPRDRSLKANLQLRNGTWEGVPRVGTIKRVEGTAHLTNDDLTINELSGEALGARWKLEGAASLRAPAPTIANGGPGSASAEFRLSSRADVASLIATFPDVNAMWQPQGNVDIAAVCHGPLQPRLFLDCLAQADVRNVTLSGSKLSSPISNLQGHVEYDALAQRLTITRLAGSVTGETLAGSGEIQFLPTPQLAVEVDGTLPLPLVNAWLPDDAPVRDMGGLAVLDLHGRGHPKALRYTGRLELRDARMTASSAVLERINGYILLDEAQCKLQHVALQANGQPLTVDLTMTPSPFAAEKTPQARSRISSTITAAQSKLRVEGELTPEDLLIREGDFALAQSRVRFRGSLGRSARRVSSLTAAGTVEVSDLSRLPFLSLPAVEAWKLRGVTTVEAQFEGALADLPQATIESWLRADRLTVRDIPLDQLLCTVEQHAGVLRVRLPAASVADGKLWGELTIEPGERTHDYLLQADVLGLKVERLTAFVPAWRSQTMVGTAAAHAMLLGSWEDRGTWRGQGWLNIVGERLGELPLLEKIFRGLFGVLADRMGLETLRRAQINQASVQWRLSDQRFNTEELRLAGLAGTEPVAIYAKGSVGLDRTLDFVIEPELSENVLVQSPATSTLASTVLKAAGGLERLRRLIGRHRLTGTLDKPEYRFEFTTQELLKQFLGPSPGDLLQDILQQLR